MTGHIKRQEGDTITHSFVDPKDVVIEKIEGEYIIGINRGYPTERSFTFDHIHIDVFVNDDIVMGINNPDQLASFFDVRELVVEFPIDQGICLVEMYCLR